MPRVVVRINRITWLGLFIACLAILAVVVHLVTTDTEFSRYNVGWNGTSLFFTRAGEQRIPEILEPTDLTGEACRVLLLIAPRTGVNPLSMSTYRSFLENGHTIILADDFNGGGTICRALNVSTRFLAGNLSSMDRGTSSPTSVIARSAGSTDLLGNISSLLLNRPAALEGGIPLMTTSVLSWIDTDGDGWPGNDEVLRRYPVVTRDRIGGGDLIVIADASLFINGMGAVAPEYDNARILATLLSTKGLCLDQMESRTVEGGFLARGITVVKHTYIIQLALVATVLFTLAIAWRKGDR